MVVPRRTPTTTRPRATLACWLYGTSIIIVRAGATLGRSILGAVRLPYTATAAVSRTVANTQVRNTPFAIDRLPAR